MYRHTESTLDGAQRCTVFSRNYVPDFAKFPDNGSELSKSSNSEQSTCSPFEDICKYAKVLTMENCRKRYIINEPNDSNLPNRHNSGSSVCSQPIFSYCYPSGCNKHVLLSPSVVLLFSQQETPRHHHRFQIVPKFFELYYKMNIRLMAWILKLH